MTKTDAYGDLKDVLKTEGWMLYEDRRRLQAALAALRGELEAAPDVDGSLDAALGALWAAMEAAQNELKLDQAREE